MYIYSFLHSYCKITYNYYFSGHNLPKITQHPVSVQCLPGQVAELACSFESDSNVQVSWFKEGELLRSGDLFDIQTIGNSSRLSVLMTNEELQGDYLCTVRNVIGEVLTETSIYFEGIWCLYLWHRILVMYILCGHNVFLFVNCVSLWRLPCFLIFHFKKNLTNTLFTGSTHNNKHLITRS